jgi:hypothetical protein
MASSGDLITRNYSNFMGVDFSNYKVNVYRSPDSKNMWKNYRNLGKYIETRPTLRLFKELENINGIFPYMVDQVQHLIIHSGTKLIDYNCDTETTTEIKSSGMNPVPISKSFIFNNILYIIDGLNYLRYDGETVADVIGYVPTTSISRIPDGGGKQYQDVNLLTGYRKNSFVGDGVSTEYHLDTTNIETGTVTVWINGSTSASYSVDSATGVVTFTTPPSAPLTDGQDNVVIQFRKSINGYRDRIEKCTLLEVFDNRVFFSGNPDYPSTVFYSSLEDPSYISDTDYSQEGLDGTPVKALVAGNNALWVFKEPSQSNTTVFYHVPSIDSEVGKVYPSSHSSIAKGCVATAINFNDDIVMFSDDGMEGITGDISTEQFLSHRSSLVDSRLVNEPGYSTMKLAEWEGYLLVFVENHVYLADSRQRFSSNNNIEYEWYYWELSKDITCTNTLDGKLYLGTSDGIYVLDGDDDIESYWTTCTDDLGYLNYQKTTNKRGCVADIKGTSVKVYARTDNNEFELIDEYENTKGYIVPRIKRKKWKDIQFKFLSEGRFGIYDFSIQSFIGSYVKR